MKLVVGLGNPGKDYNNTRHNVGFMIIDNYLKEDKYQEKFNGLYTEKIINGEKVIFLKPQTFMNNSGNSVGKFVSYFNINHKDILVIQDDLDISFGSYKLKTNNSSGGHNGIKSIIAALGSDDFCRLKVGISTAKKDDVIDFVLGKFSKDELNKLNALMDTYTKIIDSFITSGIDKTMNIYNSK